MHETVERIVFPSGRSAEIALRAVRPELNKAHQKRSKTSIKTNKNVVLLKIVARDEHALKASRTSFMGLLELSKSASEF